MHSYKHEIKKVFFATLVTSVITASLFVLNSNDNASVTNVDHGQNGNWSNMAQLQAALL